MKQKPTYSDLLKKVEKLEKKNRRYKKDRSALKKSEERFNTYFDENTSGKYISTPDGYLIACNKEYERIFGFKNTKDALNTPLRSLSIDPQERDFFLNTVKQNRQVFQHKPEMRKRNGNPIHVIENVIGVFDNNDNLEQVRGFLQDITEQKNLQLQLLQAQKMEAIGTLAGGVAHDFNNILSSIFGYSQLAILQVEEPEKANESINQIMKSAQRASNLVQQILTYSRQTEYKPQSLKISTLLKEMLKLLRSSIPANIEINEKIHSNARVMVDSTQIHQVIMNLCTNAYHAMSDTGGKLTIELEKVHRSNIEHDTNINLRAKHYLKLVIRDTGHGIEGRIKNRIFDPYFTTKETGKGTGLGLAVVVGIVKNHEGFIKCYSEVGKGSTFATFWPINDLKLTKKITDRNNFGLCMGNEKIMFVDDEVDILNTSKALLKRLGYKIETFVDSVTALKIFTETPDSFDLIITDLTMPKMSGDRFSKEVLKIRKNMPIIMCSGFNENFDQNMAKAIGIKKYIQKPVTNQKLSSSIRQIMASKINHNASASLSAIRI